MAEEHLGLCEVIVIPTPGENTHSCRHASFYFNSSHPFKDWFYIYHPRISSTGLIFSDSHSCGVPESPVRGSVIMSGIVHFIHHNHDQTLFHNSQIQRNT